MGDVVSLKEQVALACRILAQHGHTDLTLGHVSARGPENIIYIKRKDLGLDEVLAKDIIGIDFDRNVIDGEGDVHLETILHIEAYKARNDVMAVSHTHPPYSVALGATDATLSMINHDSLMFFEGLGNFSELPGLVTNSDMGKAVAEALGHRRAVIMRNHGVLVVGKSIPWLVYANLTLERAIMIQTIANKIGNLTPISQEVAAETFKEKYRDEFVDGYWRYLLSKLDKLELNNGFRAETFGSSDFA